jgi:hypothetical protein
MKTRTRLTTDQKMRALALLARGDTLSQVVGHLLDYYQVTVSESALSQLRSNNKETIAQMQQVVADGQSAEAEAIATRARRLINNKLDRAERDAKTLEELDQDYRDGKIKDVQDYRRRKAGLMKISINELTTISKAMHSQSQHTPIPPAGDTPPALQSGSHSGATPAHLEAMLQAIAAGNTVELQRLVFNPKGAVTHGTPITV